MTDHDIELQVRAVLSSNPEATMRNYREAGIRGEQSRIEEIVDRVKKSLARSFFMKIPDDSVFNEVEEMAQPISSERFSRPAAPETAPVFSSADEVLDSADKVSASWERFHLLLQRATAADGLRELDKCRVLLGAVRDMLTTTMPLNVPGRGMLPRNMTDGERIRLISEVCGSISRNELTAATVDQMYGRTLNQFMIGFQRVLESEVPREHWRRVYGLLRESVRELQNVPLSFVELDP